MTPQQAGELIKRILGAFPTQRLRMTPVDIGAMTVAYTAGLIDLDFAIARDAVDRANKTSEFIPSIALIRAEAGEVAHGAPMTGAEAWGSVLAAIRGRGSHRTPGVDFGFRDPITAELVASFGWQELCGADGKGMVANRARFIEAYDEIVRQRRKNVQASHGAVAPQLAAGQRDRRLEARVGRAAPMHELVDAIAPDDDEESGGDS